MTVGHKIMRAAHPSSHSIYRAPLSSSAVAGALGGLFSISAVLLGIFLLSVGKNNQAGNAISTIRRRVLLAVRCAGYTTFVIYFFSAGGIAGALYTLNTRSAGRDATSAQQAAALAAYNKAVAEGKHLSVSAATAAGFVGGAVVGPGLVLVATLGVLAWARMPNAFTSPPLLELVHREPPRGV